MVVQTYKRKFGKQIDKLIVALRMTFLCYDLCILERNLDRPNSHVFERNIDKLYTSSNFKIIFDLTFWYSIQTLSPNICSKYLTQHSIPTLHPKAPDHKLPYVRLLGSLIWSEWDKNIIIWAPSSEFVSSSNPSLQILTAHAQPFRGARDLAFCLKVPLDSLLVWASSEGSGETARMRRLAWIFAARIGDKYQIRLTRSSW